MISETLDKDLKAALLARDELRITTLRSLKSALTYAAVEARSKGGSGELSDDDILAIMTKEAKKRQESADAFMRGAASDRAERELAEKKIIEGYLPDQLSDVELEQLVDKTISELGAVDAGMMGRVVGATKASAGSRADGSRIASLVKRKLS